MEYLGEYNQQIDRKNISPEVFFLIDLNNAYNFLQNFLSSNEYDLIKNNLDSYNHQIYKNPALIVISFIFSKNSYIKRKKLDENVFKSMYSNAEISPLLKENNISLYDIVRYSRYIQLHIPKFISYFELL